MINLELRAGKPRAEALHNLAARTGVDDLTSLVAILVQTDKFDERRAGAARVFRCPSHEATSARGRSRCEDGGKDGLSARHLHLPGDLIVTLGPAAIKFVQVLGPMAANNERRCNPRRARGSGDGSAADAGDPGGDRTRAGSARAATDEDPVRWRGHRARACRPPAAAVWRD